MKEWFKARNIWNGAFTALSDAEAGRLAKALWHYTTTGEQVELSGNEKGCFAMFVYTLQQDDAESGNLSEKRRSAGSKGGQQRIANQAIASFASEVQAKQAIASNKSKNTEEDIKETTLKGSKEKRQRFSPPTVDEVAAYCKERGNKVDPNRFVDFYASKGWKVGQNPMKDWKAAVRTWEQRDEHPAQAPGKVVSAARYDQRPYDEKALEDQLGVNDIFAPDWKGAS